jgi:two-component system, NarL family, response regulator
VRQTLAADFDVQESASGSEAIELIRDVGNIDVAVVDLHCGADGAPSGGETIRELRRAAPALGIVAHGDRAERHLAIGALQAGATAYVARTARAAEMTRAVRAALEQERFVDPAVPPKGSRSKLTRRQREILQRLADGESTTVAARELDLSEETVKTHTKHAVARLGARNRTHAVAIALRESLID